MLYDCGTSSVILPSLPPRKSSSRIDAAFSDGTDGSLTEGNLYLFNDPLKEGKGWLDKYYLYQVPTTEILLNPELEQNPGW